MDGDRGDPGIGGRKPLIIIADAHVSKARGNFPPFFRLLEALARQDDDLVFLGDIFDLWVALPRYENELHRQFLDWCRRQKTRRSIGYLEGNREFFLAESHAEAFSWCSPGPWHQDRHGHLFCHGDQINTQDIRYLTFRKLSKNRYTKMLLTHLPLGPAMVEYLKRRLKHSNPAFRRRLPDAQIVAFAEARFGDGAQTVFAGHFHQAHRYQNPEGRQLHTLPAWCVTGCVSHYDSEKRTVRSIALAHQDLTCRCA